MPQTKAKYISTDPNAGAPQYLSTDPNAGQQSQAAPISNTPGSPSQPSPAPSFLQRLKSWWNTPTPLVAPNPNGEGGWVPLPGTDVSPGQHITKAVEDAAMIAGAGAPLAEMAAGRSIVPIAKTVGRSLIGSAVGGAGGSWIGRYGGQAFGDPELGEKIGGTVGGLAGGIYGGMDRPIYGPWGHEYSIGKMLPFLQSDEAKQAAAQKAMGAFMNKGYQNVNDLPFLPSGSSAPSGSAQKPFEPLIWESPEEASAHDVRMKNLQRQASSSGTYHAAQGAAGKRTNLQQRIGKKSGAFYGNQ